MPTTRVWIAGPRSWEDRQSIRLILAKLVKTYGKDYLVILHGGAAGVDMLADRLAKRNGIHTARVDALWDSYHRAAGPKRNKAIAGLDPHLLVAFYFWDELVKHAGTFSAVTIAHGADIPVKLIHVSPDVAMPSSVSDTAPLGKTVRAAKGLPPRSKTTRRKPPQNP